jgi:hypothetical protein
LAGAYDKNQKRMFEIRSIQETRSSKPSTRKTREEMEGLDHEYERLVESNSKTRKRTGAAIDSLCFGEDPVRNPYNMKNPYPNMEW